MVGGTPARPAPVFLRVSPFARRLGSVGCGGMPSLLIRDALLHDGSGTGPVPGASLLSVDGVITYAGPESNAPQALSGARILRAEGRSLLPGLIDCHVHLCLDGGADFMAEARVPEDEAIARATRNALRALDAGITTVRDLGGIGRASIVVAERRRRGEIAGARILTAGSVVTVRGGHAHVIGREADTAEELVAAVADLHAEGADVVKIIATGGVLTEGVDATSATYTEE